MDMSEPVAKDLDEAKELREVIDALRADNGKLLRLFLSLQIPSDRFSR